MPEIPRSRRNYKKEKEEDNILGRRDYDQLGITHLFDKIERVDERVVTLQETVNNGLYSTAHNNKEEICKVRDDVSDIKEYIRQEAGSREGRSSLLISLRDWGGWIFGLITLLLYLMEVGII